MGCHYLNKTDESSTERAGFQLREPGDRKPGPKPLFSDSPKRGYQEEHPEGFHATRRLQDREIEASVGHDEREAITDEAPEVLRPRLVVQRTQKQRRGSPYIDTKQELLEENPPQKMSIHDKEDPRNEGAHRGKSLERKHSKARAYRSETESAQYEKAKETAADRAPEGPDIHRVFRGHPTQGRKDPTLDAEREPQETPDPIRPIVNTEGE